MIKEPSKKAKVKSSVCHFDVRRNPIIKVGIMLRKFGFAIGLLSAIIISLLLGLYNENEPLQFIGKVLTNLIFLIVITSIYSLFKGFRDFDFKFGIVSIICLTLLVLEMIINKFLF